MSMLAAPVDVPSRQWRDKSVLPWRVGAVSWCWFLWFGGLEGGVPCVSYVASLAKSSYVGPEGARVLEQSKDLCHLYRLTACESFGLVYLGDGDC